MQRYLRWLLQYNERHTKETEQQRPTEAHAQPFFAKEWCEQGRADGDQTHSENGSNTRIGLLDAPPTNDRFAFLSLAYRKQVSIC